MENERDRVQKGGERQIKSTIDCRRGRWDGSEGKKIGSGVIDGQRGRKIQTRERRSGRRSTNLCLLVIKLALL